jgi:hypothetical protein
MTLLSSALALVLLVLLSTYTGGAAAGGRQLHQLADAGDHGARETQEAAEREGVDGAGKPQCVDCMKGMKMPE